MSQTQEPQELSQPLGHTLADGLKAQAEADGATVFMEDINSRTVELAEDDFALIIKKDCKVEVFVPVLANEQFTPPHVLLGTVLMMMIRDEEKVKELVDEFVKVIQNLPQNDDLVVTRPEPGTTTPSGIILT